MKNNIDTFIKYLDNQLSVEEREQFKDQLIEDPVLNEEFSSFIDKFYENNNDIQVDETYFENLIINTRKSIDAKNNFTFRGIAFAIPIIVLVVFFAFNELGNLDNNNLSTFDSLLNDTNVLELILNSDFEDEKLYDFGEEILEDYYTEVSIDESMFDYLSEQLSINDINNSIISNLTESEFDNIYAELIDKKILGEK